MSPLKIAIATFVVGLIGLTASAMIRSRSTGEHASQPALGTTTILGANNTWYEYTYKPHSPELKAEDIVKYLDPTHLGHYKKCLRSLHLYDKGREGYNIDGSQRKYAATKRYSLLNDIQLYEGAALEKKEQDPEQWEWARARLLARPQAEQQLISTQEHESSNALGITPIFVGKNGYDYILKPRSPDLTAEDIVKYGDQTDIGRYKKQLTSLHLYDTGREEFKLDGTKRKKILSSREMLEDEIESYERAALEKKEQDPEQWEWARARLLARSQAEQLDGAQAGSRSTRDGSQPAMYNPGSSSRSVSEYVPKPLMKDLEMKDAEEFLVPEVLVAYKNRLKQFNIHTDTGTDSKSITTPIPFPFILLSEINKIEKYIFEEKEKRVQEERERLQIQQDELNRQQKILAESEQWRAWQKYMAEQSRSRQP